MDYGWLVISFHLLSFVFQGFAALTACCNKGVCGYHYETMVEDGRNPLRFIEYSISASVMLVIISLINGIIDSNLLVCIAVLTCSCQLCGLVVEYLNDDQRFLQGVLHGIGWLTFLTAYSIIFRAYFASIEKSQASPPLFVTLIVIFLFALYGSFGVVQLYEIIAKTVKTKTIFTNVRR